MKKSIKNHLLASYERPVLSVSEFDVEQGFASSSQYGFNIQMKSATLS